MKARLDKEILLENDANAAALGEYAAGAGKGSQSMVAVTLGTGVGVVISHCENLEGAMALKRQILADLPVKQVDLLSCRGLTSFYAMEKGLIVGY